MELSGVPSCVPDRDDLHIFFFLVSLLRGLSELSMKKNTDFAKFKKLMHCIYNKV